MENGINIAELLKDSPKGMKLYSPIWGEVYLDKIRPHLSIVVATDKEQGDLKEEFLYDGRYGMNGECMLFPSKSKTTWEGFVPPYFKVGDVVQDVDAYKVKITEVDIENYWYVYESVIAKGTGSINFSEQDNWKLAPNKFDINTLVPFESKVLVRGCNSQEWVGEIFTRYNNKVFDNCNFVTLGGICWKQCIPYNDNTKHLLGTTFDCDDYYKTWE